MNILLTGAGAPGGPGIIKALKQSVKINLIVADCDANASGRFLNDTFEILPKANDVNFIPEIKRICSKHDIDCIFPLVTNELFHFANYKQEFLNDGIMLIVSDSAWLKIANDKRKLFEHLSSNNIEVPKFHVVHTVQEFEEAATKLGYPNSTFCFKPSISNGSRGFRVISNEVSEYQLLFNLKPNSTYMSYEKALEILASQTFPELLVTEYLPGDEYTIDTIVNNGEPQIIIPRKRIQMREGISIRGAFEKHEAIIDYCRQIIKSMHLHGPIGIQVKGAADGTFKILEINPRIQGTSVAALGMDVNLPLIAVMQEFEMHEALLPKEIKWGTKFVRYYQEVFYD